MSDPTCRKQSKFDFSGMFWFRREVDVPLEWAGWEIILAIGAADKDEETYFNNVRGRRLGDDGSHWRLVCDGYLRPWGRRSARVAALVGIRYRAGSRTAKVDSGLPSASRPFGLSLRLLYRAVARLAGSRTVGHVKRRGGFGGARALGLQRDYLRPLGRRSARVAALVGIRYREGSRTAFSSRRLL
jgi:hypothetical protein